MYRIFMRATPSALATLLAASAHAQAPGNATPTIVIDLEPITVTATPGIVERVRDVQASVEILGRDRVNAVPATSTPRILQQAQGVLPIDNGSTSSFSTMRGFQPGQALVLVDGQRRRGRFGFQDLVNIDPTNIERIEIIRGPLSALYGADAVAGVINIITKRPSDTAGGEADAMFGQLTSTHGGQRGNRITERLSLAGDTGKIETPVGTVSNRFSTSGLERGAWSSKGTTWDELKPAQRRFAGWSGVWDIVPGQTLEGRFEWQRQIDSGTGSNGARTPAPTVSYERQEDFYGAATYAGDFGRFGTLRATASTYESASATRRAGAVNTTNIVGKELNAFWNVVPYENHRVTLGANVLGEEIKLNSILSGQKSRSSFGFVAQDQWRFLPDWSVLAGVRLDNFSDFGSSVNPRASLQWTPGPWTFRIGGGSAFRAPNFQELYTTTFRGASTIFGNAALRPESSTSYEASAGYRFNERTDLNVTYFRANVDDLITFVQTGPTTFNYRNVNKAKLQGTEATVTSRVTDTLTMRIGLDWNDATDGITGARLTQRARYTVRSGIDWQAREDTHVNVFWRGIFNYYGGTPQNPNLTPVNSNYHRLDVRVDHELRPGVRLYVGIDGLLGQSVPFNLAPMDPPGPFAYGGISLRF